MARPLRVQIRDGWYHVMSRGIERRVIFRDKRDRRHYLEILEESVDRFNLRVHAYVLMDNHYHLLLQTPAANLSRSMQWINQSYSAWFNARHNRIGPLFHGRFKAVPVEGGAWVVALSEYIHLNPIRTKEHGLGKQERKAEGLGLKKPSAEEVRKRRNHLRTYPWSSYRACAGYESVPEWLTMVDIWRRSKGRNGYRESVETLVSQGVDEGWLNGFRNRFAIGSEKFREDLKNLIGEPGREETGKAVFRQRATFEEIVSALEELRGESWPNLLARHGDWSRAMAIRLSRRLSGMTLQEIGERLNGTDYAAVSAMDRRFARKLSRSKELKKEEARLLRILNVEM
ncbi:MAG: transposase [Verrucomicrobia bacterium]|nr:transposase [Verrucomicrobiota bacterium]